jgi:plasmid stabilization system protein ParE
MKLRYTESARREFDENVEYLREHASSVVGDFADSIEKAVGELLDHPYSAQETEKQGVRRKYIRRFRYAIFYAVDREADELVILHIRHAARRWPWLDEEDE